MKHQKTEAPAVVSWLTRRCGIEKITNKRAILVEHLDDGTWVGYIYRKHGVSWYMSGRTSYYDTQEKARSAAIITARGRS